MNLANCITIAKNDLYSILVDKTKNRAYLVLKGKWEKNSSLENYLSDIKLGISKLKPDFTLLVDLTQYGGTSSDLYSIHIDSLKLAVNSGLKRAAEVFNNNPLLKLLFECYAKESGANTMEFFDMMQAENWLDLYTAKDQ
ncbi:hypothetical protein [Acetivibrio cellulolyticus]|uniref:hypothetical protein n=1 Tax=Acetivibrio cellulolyticus TaxID=35830 RepID=UPI0001E2EB62|nr:hypothetical protein [Acetivibrio cellulolyticus]